MNTAIDNNKTSGKLLGCSGQDVAASCKNKDIIFERNNVNNENNKIVK